MRSRRYLVPWTLAALLSIPSGMRAQAAIAWGGVGGDFSLGANWVGLSAPGAGDIGLFSAVTPTVQPLLNSAFSVGGLRFGNTAGTHTLGGTGTLTIGSYGIENLSTVAQAITVPSVFNATSATITNAGTLTLSGALSNQTTSGLTLGGAGASGTISGALGGTGKLIKTGVGTWTLGDANTFSGGTVLNEGVLSIASDSALGAVPGTPTPGNITFNGGTLRNTANLTLNSNRGITLLAGGGTLNVPIGTILNYGGVIIGAGTLTKSGAGGLQLTSANTYSGATILKGGLTSIAADASFGAVPATATDGHLSLDTASIGTSSNVTLHAHRGVVLEAGGGFFSPGSGTTLTINGAITGVGDLSLNTGGTLVLAGANTYAGVTSVNAGTLRITNSSALGQSTGGTTVTSGATLHLSGDVTIASEPLTLRGSGVGGAGALLATGASMLGGPITLAQNSTISVQSQNNTTSSLFLIGGIDESGGARSLTKTGSGLLYIAGPTTYTGGTVINQGTLALSGSNTLPSTGGLVINATNGGFASFEIGAAPQTLDGLTFGGAGANTFGVNRVVLGTSGVLTLAGPLTYDATNNPGGATITGASGGTGGAVSLGSAQRTFNIGDSVNAFSEVTIRSAIAGTSGITKTGAGALTLGGASTFQGGVQVNAGALYLASSTSSSGSTVLSGPAGTGAISLASGTTLGASAVYAPNETTFQSVYIANPISLANNVTLGVKALNSDERFTVAGLVTAAAGNVTVHLGGESPLFLTGGLRAPNAATTTLTFDSGLRPDRGAVVLAGPTDASVLNITASNAVVVFGSAAAIPTVGTIHANNGYIGIANTGIGAAPTATAVLARIIDRAGFVGTLGFDTDVEITSTPRVYSEALDLTGFGTNFTLGSASRAVLTGAITPAANGYAFGNGGGALFVDSALGGNYGVTVNSANTTFDNGLAVILGGNNSFTGNLAVTNSAVVLDSPNALPAGRTASLGANGYLGFTEQFTSAPDFASMASRIASYTSTSIIGFDSHGYLDQVRASGDVFFTGDARFVHSAVDLTNLNSVYLGTATSVVLGGPISAPNQGGANRTLSLAGVGDGYLFVTSALRDGPVSRVVVGTNSAQLGAGTVMLAGANTYAGGTTLLGGQLLLAGSSKVSGGTILSGPLGTGTLTVPATALAPSLTQFPITLDSATSDTVLHNNLALGSALTLGKLEINLGGGGDAAAALAAEVVSNPFGQLVLNGTISDLGGAGSLKVYGPVALNGANSFSGGVTLHGGALTLGTNTALGSGPLTIEPVSLDFESASVALGASGGSRIIANNLVLNLHSNSTLPFVGNGSLMFTGSVTLNSDVTFEPMLHPVHFTGSVGGFGRVVGSGYNAVVLSGSNAYTGGTTSQQGAIIFGSAASIPSTPVAGLVAQGDGYIGVASAAFANSLQTNFVDRFNKPATSGAIGFDSAHGGPTNTFAGNIDLTGFGYSARLGSATSAILTGTITPQGSFYNFGGGGGLLEVNSALVNGASPRGVYVDSTVYGPLTLRLGGANTYTGFDGGVGTQVTTSAVIFKAGALPATGALAASVGAYIGTEDTSAPQAFVNRFDAASTSHAIIGFDSFTGTPYALTGPLSLAGFTQGYDAHIFLGTATAATISGAISLPAAQSTYRFAGYKGGQLTVASTLDGSRSVQIGDQYSPATYGNPTSSAVPLSAVTLTGNNTYTGGTVLEAGQLFVTRNSALGTGTLTVVSPGYQHGQTINLPEAPSFGVAAATDPVSGQALSIGNNIVLSYSDLNLLGTADYTLAGIISGTGELYKRGSNSVTLSGANNFYGGVYIAQGNVTFAHPSAMGDGPVKLGTATGASATFAVSTTVYGLASSNSGDQVNIGAGKTLTVNQTFDTDFQGSFQSTGGSLVLRGPYSYNPTTLRLSGSSNYNGSTAIESGVTVVAANSNAFGPGANTANAVTLNGGALGVANGITVSNALTVNYGTLLGTGTINPHATLQIGGNGSVTLAPGFSGPGTLNFGNASLAGAAGGVVLNLGPGGVYQWQLLDATTSGGWDQIVVAGTVNFSNGIIAPTAFEEASPATPFTLQIMPLGSLDLLTSVANFNPNLVYSWTVLSATSITGFGSGSIFLDTSGITGAIPGTLSLTLNGPATALQLTFTPAAIPEPSTYALMGFGALVIAWSTWRRRSRN